MTFAVSPDALLAADEPAPVELLNPSGRSSVLLLCDHASNFIPRALAELGLDAAALSRHVAWDIGVADVTRRLAERLDAMAILARFSRLVVDANREPAQPSSMPEESDGLLVPGNQELSPAEREARLATFFRPYHAAIEQALDARLAAGQVPVIVSMHSFTPVMDGFARPWQVGILWNHDSRLALPIIAMLEAQGHRVGDNEPYSGRDHHGYTLHHHADPRGLPNVLIELRQDLIDTHKGAEEWAGVLGGVLESLLHDPALARGASHPEA